MADEAKQLISCLRNINNTESLSSLMLQSDSRGSFISNSGEVAKHT